SFISFQPSELAKFALVIFAAMYMSRKDFQGKSALSYLPVAAAGGLMCILIILEPNMSVTVCVGLIMLCMLFVGGLNKKAFIIFILCAVCALPILILLEPYRMQRFVAFLNPFASAKDEGYQLVQSLYALGSGGWFGVGLFNSRQKYKFLPFAESDFILSVIGEEIGFIGVLVVIAIFVFIIYKGVKIAINAKDRFCGLLSGGITFVIAIQTIINIAVVSASIPPTGIPLPFISMGGSSLAVFMGAVGLLLNVHNKS
ncbi:MAG: FtsW/RodA/SpoVE family cell cycle protein, partial [Clostridia bacterium]